MTCVNPIRAWKKRTSSLIDRPEKYYADKKIRFKDPKSTDWEEIKIPCGHCIGCRLDHANMWATRITLETREHKENCFITLTYNPQHVPINNTGHLTLRKKDFQDFIKRLRHHLGIKVSYFLCGEYGTLGRPHGHLCLFGWIPKDLEQIMNSKTENPMFTSKTLEKIWGNGYVVVQELNYKTACYTARYVQKKAGIKPQKRLISNEPPEPTAKIDERTGKAFLKWKVKTITDRLDQYGREKEFLLMSKKPAIGLKYWNENKKKIIRNEGILIKLDNKVQKKPIPRYYKKIWEKTNMSEFDTFKYKEKTKAIENYKKKLEQITGNNKELTLRQTIKNNLINRTKFLKREQN